MKIAIAGRKKATENYVRYVSSVGADPIVTLNQGEIAECDALLLPGGGDINPAFFGKKNCGSRNIDTELDILQLQAFILCTGEKKPILGICKGMQIINVGLGGTIVQDLPTAFLHRYADGDQYHTSFTRKDSWPDLLYGREARINSAHHQSLGKIGKGLQVVQHCPLDNCPEAIAHESLPILGVQWHPERLQPEQSSLSGEKVLLYLLSLIPSSRQ
ncbi:MAG: gamma-glutamyl-gamma-aminobutyrate hydrolase family protein [Acetatifactor sp.]